MAARQHRPDRPCAFPLLARQHPRSVTDAPSPVLAMVGPLSPPRLAPHHSYRAAVLFALLMGVLGALAWGASAEVIGRAGQALGWLANHDTPRGRALAAVLCAVTGALALAAAWARETAERRPVRLADGRARMAVDDVAATLRDALVDEAGLADADVRVDNLHRRGLRVTVRADVQPQARIDETIDLVDELVTEIVQHYMGARLAARPAVDVRYRELDLRVGRGT